MKLQIGKKLIGLLFLLGLLATHNSVRAQDPAASPSPAPDSPVAQPASPPLAAATPEPEFSEQEEMTGDWGGTRSRWKAKGVDLGFKLTQFGQGVVSGGLTQNSEYNGKFETRFKFDLGKIAGWQFWSAEVKTETRFGGSLLGVTGTVGPVNTGALVPGTDGGVFAITALNFTKLIPIDLAKGNLVAVSFGRFNMLDLVMEDFFGGSGIDRFFNLAENAPLTTARTVPLVANGATIAWVKGGQPFLVLAVLDPNDHQTDAGLNNLFADGVTLAPGINFPSKFGNKSGLHSFGFTVTTKAYTPFDQIRHIILPGPPIVPITSKRGSWSVSYTGRQYLVERGPKDGWGLFFTASKADAKTNPFSTLFSAGLGGNGLFKSRNRDEFGVAFAYTDLSDTLKRAIDPLNRVRAELQFESFYNFHLTPWLRLTGDLQVIRPTRSIANTAIVPGARVQFIF